MEHFELRIPPPVVTLIGAILIWLSYKILPFLNFGFKGQLGIGIILIILAGVLGMGGILSFYKVSTTINPGKPELSTSLVTDGIYKFTRNPMYLGLFFGLCGFAVLLGNPLNILILILFVLYITRFQIMPEERRLREKFGVEYEDFLRTTRRWI